LAFIWTNFSDNWYNNLVIWKNIVWSFPSIINIYPQTWWQVFSTVRNFDENNRTKKLISIIDKDGIEKCIWLPWIASPSKSYSSNFLRNFTDETHKVFSFRRAYSTSEPQYKYELLYKTDVVLRQLMKEANAWPNILEISFDKWKTFSNFDIKYINETHCEYNWKKYISKILLKKLLKI
jgi:hypothetical protein